MTPSQPDDEAITPAGREALEAELEELRTSGRRAMAARILAARELGDLKENADYHIAKNDQAHLETRIKRLHERLLQGGGGRDRHGRLDLRLRPHGRGGRRRQRRGPHLDDRGPDRG